RQVLRVARPRRGAAQEVPGGHVGELRVAHRVVADHQPGGIGDGEPVDLQQRIAGRVRDADRLVEVVVQEGQAVAGAVVDDLQGVVRGRRDDRAVDELETAAALEEGRIADDPGTRKHGDVVGDGGPRSADAAEGGQGPGGGRLARAPGADGQGAAERD